MTHPTDALVTCAIRRRRHTRTTRPAPLPLVAPWGGPHRLDCRCFDCAPAGFEALFLTNGGSDGLDRG